MTQLLPHSHCASESQFGSGPRLGAQPPREAGGSPEEMREPQGTELIAADRTEPSGGDFRGRQWAHRRPGDKSWRKRRARTISDTGLPRVFPRFTPGSRGVGPGRMGEPPSGSGALSSLQPSRCRRTVAGKAAHWPRVQRSNKLGLFHRQLSECSVSF